MFFGIHKISYDLLKIINFVWVSYQKRDEDILMEQHALKSVNNCLITNIYSYLETSGGQSSNAYLNVVHFFNTRVD